MPPTRKKLTYALSPRDIPPDVDVFLDAVSNYFTRAVNLERQSAAVAQSTFLKARERMMCKSLHEHLLFAVNYLASLFAFKYLARKQVSNTHVRHTWPDFLFFCFISRLPWIFEEISRNGPSTRCFSPPKSHGTIFQLSQGECRFEFWQLFLVAFRK